MTSIETYYEYGELTAPQGLVILLHGLGSNGQDLIGLAPHWAKDLPGVAFVSPDAPFACDMTPPGYPNSYQWFSLQDRSPDVMEAGAKHAAPILMDFITQQAARFDLPFSKVALMGFSQGTMMSLYTAPHLDHTLAAVVGYSGALLNGQTLSDTQKPAVCLIHGEADDVVPVQAYHDAYQSLSAAGFSVSGHTTPGLAHSIDEAGLIAGGQFLAKHLS